MANATGFPSPAQGYEEKALNFNSLIVKNPSSTFTMRYKGKGIESHCVKNDDLLVVDCVVFPKKDSLVIIRTFDGFECHPIIDIQNSPNGKIFIYSDNYGKHKVCYEIFGVVRAVLRLFI